MDGPSASDPHELLKLSFDTLLQIEVSAQLLGDSNRFAQMLDQLFVTLKEFAFFDTLLGQQHSGAHFEGGLIANGTQLQFTLFFSRIRI